MEFIVFKYIDYTSIHDFFYSWTHLEDGWCINGHVIAICHCCM